MTNIAQNTKNPTADAKGPEQKGSHSAGGDAKAGAPKDGAAKKKYTVTLGFSSLMTGLTVFLGCVFMAFMLGVIVGRDENPPLPGFAHEDAIPMPVEEEAQSGDDALAAAVRNAENQGQQGNSVMAPEELKYATDLKNDPSIANAPVTNQGAAQAENAASQSASTAASTPTAPATPGSGSMSAAGTVQAPAAPQPPALYDYIFQVATFKDEASVDKLRAKLEGEGMRTRMDKSGKFFRVMVLMRGDEAQAQAFRERMVALKLGEPIQRQKAGVQ